MKRKAAERKPTPKDVPDLVVRHVPIWVLTELILSYTFPECVLMYTNQELNITFLLRFNIASTSRATLEAHAQLLHLMCYQSTFLFVDTII